MHELTSFRDPAGHLVSYNKRVFRFVRSSSADELKSFLRTRTAEKYSRDGQLVTSTFIENSAEKIDLSHTNSNDLGDFVLIEHPKVFFPSFPYEWPPEMLHAAGMLTLNLAIDLLEENFQLKDATPYNVLFVGGKPIFIDVLSFERRDVHNPTWLPYAQFLRTFLLPLLVNKHFHLRLNEQLINKRDGLEPEDVYDLLSVRQKFQPEFLTVVSLPSWLASRKKSDRTDLYRTRRVADPGKAAFIIDHMLKGLRRRLDSSLKTQNESSWSDYMQKNRYTEEYFPDKEKFVKDVFIEFMPKNVLDVGCNTGFFSRLAAEHGSNVIAIDSDSAVVGEVWQSAHSKGLNIQPLVVDIARPTPATGWVNEECSSFLNRSRGSFDAVLMLAVIHHLLVTERIPLNRILQLAQELTTDLLIIEFIAPTDKMFRLLTRGRDYLHVDLTLTVFEQAARAFFDVVRSTRLGDSDRWIYLLKKKRWS